MNDVLELPAVPETVAEKPTPKAARKKPAGGTPAPSRGETLADVLGDGSDRPLAEVRGLVGDAALNRAWAAGEIEFGRRNHCLAGPAGRDGSKLLIEDGYEWTGPKTKLHKGFAELVKDRPPRARGWVVYVREYLAGKSGDGLDIWRAVTDETPEGAELRWAPRKITEAEALALLELRVRLTDLGNARLAAG